MFGRSLSRRPLQPASAWGPFHWTEKGETRYCARTQGTACAKARSPKLRQGANQVLVDTVTMRRRTRGGGVLLTMSGETWKDKVDGDSGAVAGAAAAYKLGRPSPQLHPRLVGAPTRAREPPLLDGPVPCLNSGRVLCWEQLRPPLAQDGWAASA